MAKWLEIVCYVRDPEAAELVRPMVYQCSHCGRLAYEKTETCECGCLMEVAE